MRSPAALCLLLASAPLAIADVAFTSPAAGASVPGGATFTVTWKDSGDPPALADLTAFQLFLYSGSNDQPQQLYPIANAAFAAGNSITATVPVGTGGPGTNAYFLGIMSTAAAGGTVTNFSNRFTLTGMTGSFSPAVAASLKTVAGTTGPETVNAVAGAAPAPGAGAPIDAGAWGTPYNEQTGLTRYAPMQPVPPTKITATNTEPLWPTSSVPIATTYLPTPKPVTTQTQSQTNTVQSHANTAAPQSQPMDDMEKFLNRWKD